MSTTDYTAWTVADLKAEADKRGLSYPSTANKSELVNLLEQNDAGVPATLAPELEPLALNVDELAVPQGFVSIESGPISQPAVPGSTQPLSTVYGLYEQGEPVEMTEVEDPDPLEYDRLREPYVDEWVEKVLRHLDKQVREHVSRAEWKAIVEEVAKRLKDLDDGADTLLHHDDPVDVVIERDSYLPGQVPETIPVAS